jgi:hypothetical protein
MSALKREMKRARTEFENTTKKLEITRKELEVRRGRLLPGVQPGKPNKRSRVSPRAILKGKISEDLDLQLLSHVRGLSNLMEVYFDRDHSILYASLSLDTGFSTFTPMKGFESSRSRVVAVSDWMDKSLYNRTNIKSDCASDYSADLILKFSSDFVMFFSPAMNFDQLEQFVSLMSDHNRFYIQNIAFDDQLWSRNENGEFKMAYVLQRFPNLQRVLLVSTPPPTNVTVHGPMSIPQETVEFIPDILIYSKIRSPPATERQVEDQLNEFLNRQLSWGKRKDNKIEAYIVGIKRNGVPHFGTGAEKQARKELEEEQINVAQVSEFCARRQVPGPEDAPTDYSGSCNASDVDMSDV